MWICEGVCVPNTDNSHKFLGSTKVEQGVLVCDAPRTASSSDHNTVHAIIHPHFKDFSSGVKVALSPFWPRPDPSYTSHSPGGNIVRCWKWTLSHFQRRWSKNAWRDSSLTNDFPQVFPPSLQWEWMSVCCLRTEGVVSHIKCHEAAPSGVARVR